MEHIQISQLMLHLRKVVSISLDTIRQESNMSREETGNCLKDSMIIKVYSNTISQNGS